MVQAADIDNALQAVSDGAARRLLTDYFEALLAEVHALREHVQSLRDEVNRLKGEQGKPDFKPGKPKGKDAQARSQDHSSERERRKPGQRGKSSKAGRVAVDREQRLEVDRRILPADAVLKGYETVIVQDVRLVRENIRFTREKWYSPSEHQTYLASLPPGYKGQFGPRMKALALTLAFGCNVTEQKMLGLFRGAGVPLSAGSLSGMLIKGHEAFHQEYTDLYRAGLESSPWQNTDHTATSVRGQAQNCQVVANPFYSVYATTEKKDRLSIINVLRNRHRDNAPTTYLIDDWLLEHMEQFKLTGNVRRRLRRLPRGREIPENEFHDLLKEHLPRLSEYHFVKLRDAAAIAAYHAQLVWPVVKLLNVDDAPQFNLVTRERGLCWVHEGRRYKKLCPHLPVNRAILTKFLARFWAYYDGLLAYQHKPTAQGKRALSAGFDKLFGTVTGYSALDEAIARSLGRKTDLLMVLVHPEIPLHNNAAELAVRTRVRKRDASYQTWTAEGTRAWDTFMSIFDTCRKLGVSFHDYLLDRISRAYAMPSLASLIRERAAAFDLGASWNTS